MDIKEFITKEYNICDNIKVISNNPNFVSGFLTIIITTNSGNTMQFNMFTCNKYASDQIINDEFGKVISDNEQAIVNAYKNTRLHRPNSAKTHFYFFIRRVKDSVNYPNEYVFSYKKSDVSTLNKNNTGLAEINLKPKPEQTKTYTLAISCDPYQILANDWCLYNLINNMEYDTIDIDGIKTVYKGTYDSYNYKGIKIYKVIKDNISKSIHKVYRNIPKRVFNSIKYQIKNWSQLYMIREKVNNEIMYIPIHKS